VTNANNDPKSAGLVFIGGLHRSGTTLLAQLLGEHPDISPLSNTNVWHDEGQFLQNVYPTAQECGGPGKFAFGTGAHLTESAVDDPAAVRRALLGAWTPFWEGASTYRLEKSPPNLLRFRFLQTVFPDARCIAIVRHPVAVAYATQPWCDTSISRLLDHWLHAHELFERDRPHLHDVHVVLYEDLVADVEGTLAGITRELGLSPHTSATEVRTDTDLRYERRFRHSRVAPVHPRVLASQARFGARLHRLGYGYRIGRTEVRR
jgi:hypothetical protein